MKCYTGGWSRVHMLEFSGAISHVTYILLLVDNLGLIRCCGPRIEVRTYREADRKDIFKIFLSIISFNQASAKRRALDG